MAGKWRKKLKCRGGVLGGIPKKSLKQGYRGGIAVIRASTTPLTGIPLPSLAYPLYSGYYWGPLLKPLYGGNLYTSPSPSLAYPPHYPYTRAITGSPTKAPIWGYPTQTTPALA